MTASKIEIVYPPEILGQIRQGVEEYELGNAFQIRVSAVCEECDHLQVEPLSLTVLRLDGEAALVTIVPFTATCEKDWKVDFLLTPRYGLLDSLALVSTGHLQPALNVIWPCEEDLFVLWFFRSIFEVNSPKLTKLEFKPETGTN